MLWQDIESRAVVTAAPLDSFMRRRNGASKPRNVSALVTDELRPSDSEHVASATGTSRLSTLQNSNVRHLMLAVFRLAKLPGRDLISSVQSRAGATNLRDGDVLRFHFWAMVSSDDLSLLAPVHTANSDLDDHRIRAPSRPRRTC
jgi:hypothetical protein